MTLRYLGTLTALGACIAAALALAGCGRYGPLDPPPSAVAPPPAPAAMAAPASALADPNAPPPPAPDSAAKTGFDAKGNPVAAPGQKRDFPLDFLLQ